MRTFAKQPSEQYTIAFDFTDRLPDGRSLSSVSVTAIRTDTGVDQTSTVIGATSVSGFRTLFHVKAGTSGLTYKITAQVTLDNNDVLEEDILMKVTAL